MSALKPDITRRDFMNGAALAIAAGAFAPSSAFAGASNATHYPPAAAGLRGAHAGSFEIAHALAWEGRQWAAPADPVDAPYDLVVIGAGISGLAAAHLFRARAGAEARILILDNHDDFGGHARRNEFSVNGRLLIGYGGSQSIEGPASYSKGARRLLKSLGVRTERFYDYFDQEFYVRRNMGAGLYFDAPTFGADRLVANPFDAWSETPPRDAVSARLDAMPYADETRAFLKRLTLSGDDFLAGRTLEEKVNYLRKTSYEDFLRRDAKAPEEAIVLLRRIPHGIWGVGWDALSALEAARWGMPGTQGLSIDAVLEDEEESNEPYIFHFPDGNASLARLLVRALLPSAIKGSTMEDIVLAPVDYAKLDEASSPTRLRLSSTAVNVAHVDGGKAVDVVYVKGDATERVRAAHVIMAGHMAMTPYICRELAEAQKEAIRFFTKIPLVYVNVALNNWRAFEKAGFHRVYSPTAFFESLELDFPVSMGGYKFAASPDEPILLHLQHIPTAPGAGFNEKEQHRAGRQALYTLSYQDFENALVQQLKGMFGAYGFDPARDIAGVTVNRWPHGYAYEYNELYDPPEWSPEKGPHLAARARLGRISFANSDTSAYAYVNGAIDAAIRAVDELEI